MFCFHSRKDGSLFTFILRKRESVPYMDSCLEINEEFLWSATHKGIRIPNRAFAHLGITEKVSKFCQVTNLMSFLRHRSTEGLENSVNWMERSVSCLEKLLEVGRFPKTDPRQSKISSGVLEFTELTEGAERKIRFLMEQLQLAPKVELAKRYSNDLLALSSLFKACGPAVSVLALRRMRNVAK
jgi:hypothetical protein